MLPYDVHVRMSRLTDVIRKLYAAAAELQELFPDRHFTLDGHLVGSIGEALARERYGLQLLPASADCHDAQCPAGRLVQIKATQRERVALYDCPDFLLVLKLSPAGEFEEIYNGPGAPAWESAGKRQKNGQRSVSLSALRRLMQDVPKEDKLLALLEQ